MLFIRYYVYCFQIVIFIFTQTILAMAVLRIQCHTLIIIHRDMSIQSNQVKVILSMTFIVHFNV